MYHVIKGDMRTLSQKAQKQFQPVHIRMSKEMHRQVVLLAELWGESISATVCRCVQICYLEAKKAARTPD